MPRCPYLTKEELCSIYDNRPKCCRNFPNRQEGSFCYIPNRCNLNCKECKDKCCNYISLDESGDFIISLDITCDKCAEKWVK